MSAPTATSPVLFTTAALSAIDTELLVIPWFEEDAPGQFEGLDRAVAQQGFQLGPLLAFSAVFGFGGAIISLLISKQVAKWSTGAQVITGREGPTQAWLVETVQRLAQRANIGMPDVAIYEGAPNAFATGAFKNSALVAVSTGLLQSMSREEVEAVLARPGEDRPGAEGSRIAIGRTSAGRYLRVIYVPEVGGVFVITAYELTGKPLLAYRRRKRRKR